MKNDWWCCKADFGHHEPSCVNYNAEIELMSRDEDIDSLRAEVARLTEERSVWIQAFGTVSTIAGDMVVDIDNPADMAQKILASVASRDATQRKAGAIWALRNQENNSSPISALIAAIERGEVKP